MGDNITNIGDGAVQINRSNVRISMPAQTPEYSEATQKFLATILSKILADRNEKALEEYKRLTEAMREPQPNQTRLQSFWDNLLKAAPFVALLPEAVDAIKEILK